MTPELRPRILCSMAVLAATTLACGAAAAAERLNVVLIIADDLRYELGGAQHPRAITPVMDRLAAAGRVFERAYCQQAVCNPSRASMLTGMRPDSLRVWDLQARFRETAPHAVSLPEQFLAHGYHTQSIGKVFHNETRTPRGRSPFNDPKSWSVAPTHSDGAHWQDWVFPEDASVPRRKGGPIQRLDVPDDSYFDGQIADAAAQAIAELAGSTQPFFLAVGFWKPHLPFNAPTRYWDLYNPEDFTTVIPDQLPEGAPDFTAHSWRELRGYVGVPAEGPLDPGLIRDLRHGYYACISYLDAQLGRVLDAVKSAGIADKTIIVLVSDHGFHLGEHNLWAKTSNYELDARVPLIITAPGLPSPAVPTRALVELTDLAPTLADMAGVPRAAPWEGISVVPALHDPTLALREAALTQYPYPPYDRNWTVMGYSLKTPDFRFVQWLDRHTGAEVAVELYDHRNDPLETRNVAADPAHAAALEPLRKIAARTYAYDPDLHR